jgi:secreted trypsin-like serine protease
MRGGPVRFACLSAILGLLLCVPAAQAEPQAQPRIIGGHPASAGQYPAQGALLLDGDFTCGGTLVSNRYFLTAAHCVSTMAGAPIARTRFSVELGNGGTLGHGQVVPFSDLDRNAAYDPDSFDNDSALFTLSDPAPASLDPMRIVDIDESSLWSSIQLATLIGWGQTDPSDGNSTSNVLLEATAPIRTDAACTAAYGTDFHPATMRCAGNGSTDTCFGDSGGPMMVSDGGVPVLAGLTSWGEGCGDVRYPGVYTRLGAPGLNQWVRDRVPMARAKVSNASPEPGQAVSFTGSTSGPADFTDLAWDFDSDGVIDAHGASPSHVYPTAGTYVARLEATGNGSDTALAKVQLNVGFPPPPPVVVTPAPVVTAPRPSGPQARVLASGQPLVRHGRFHIRVNFTEDAPRGTAIIEVFRGKKKIATARTTVRRNGSKRVTVKLSKAGRKLLRRSKSKRLKVSVRVRVKRHVLQTRKLTIRR